MDTSKNAKISGGPDAVHRRQVARNKLVNTLMREVK